MATKRAEARAVAEQTKRGQWLARFRVTGTFPLLMHRDPATGPEEEQTTAARKKKLNVQQEAETHAYRMDSGHLYIQSEAFRSSMIDACTGRKLGKLSMATLIKSCVFVDTLKVCPLLHPKTSEPISTYEIDVRRAVNGKTGSRVFAIRCLIAAWSAEVEFEYDAEMIAPEHIQEMLSLAGKICGVGSYRPKPPSWSRGKGGPFGRFAVEMVSDAPKI